jgi:hypothetical protein
MLIPDALLMLRAEMDTKYLEIEAKVKEHCQSQGIEANTDVAEPPPVAFVELYMAIHS